MHSLHVPQYKLNLFQIKDYQKTSYQTRRQCKNVHVNYGSTFILIVFVFPLPIFANILHVILKTKIIVA